MKSNSSWCSWLFQAPFVVGIFQPCDWWNQRQRLELCGRCIQWAARRWRLVFEPGSWTLSRLWSMTMTQLSGGYEGAIRSVWGTYISYIFPNKWGAKELPRLSQPSTSQELKIGATWLCFRPMSQALEYRRPIWPYGQIWSRNLSVSWILEIFHWFWSCFSVFCSLETWWLFFFVINSDTRGVSRKAVLWWNHR